VDNKAFFSQEKGSSQNSPLVGIEFNLVGIPERRKLGKIIPRLNSSGEGDFSPWKRIKGPEPSLTRSL